MLDTTNLLWYSSIAVEFLFCVYLIWTKLAKSYPYLPSAWAIRPSIFGGMYFMRGAVDRAFPSLTPTSGCGLSLFGCYCRRLSPWKCIQNMEGAPGGIAANATPSCVSLWSWLWLRRRFR